MRRFFIIHVFVFSAFCLSPDFPAAAQTSAQKNRSEIKTAYTWNLFDIYPDNNAWEKDFLRLEKEFLPEVASYHGKLTDAKNVLKALKVSDDCSRLADKLYSFAGMRSDEDTSDSSRTEMRSRIDSLYSRVSVAQAYIRPELLALSESTLRGFISDPSFAEYSHSLDALIKRKAHTLPKEQEELVSAAAETHGAMQSVFAKLSYADVTSPVIKDDKGRDVKITDSSYLQILKNANRDFRKRAFEARYRFYEDHKNTYAELMNYEVKKNIFYARTYKYGSALESALAEEFVPRQVYDNLVDSVNKRLPYLHRYVSLRKKMLNLKEVRLYDMYLPLVSEQEKKITYDEAKKTVLSELYPLGKEYIAALDSALSSRWVDVYETKGKKSGGYCWATFDTHPFILLNYNDSLNEMLTLAHEMGHALHFYYSNKTQPYPNADIPIFTAEVASTANEIIMLKHLLKNAKNDDEKLYYLDQMVEQIRGTVYTQVMYSEFEKLIHERAERGEALSADSLRKIWKDLMTRYYGKDFTADEAGTLWWARIGHFYRSFYVYKYATSMAAANQLVKNMDDGKNAEGQKKYLEFLKSGGSDYPVDILKKAGVDMISSEPVDSILADFNTYVNEMERIMKKKGKIK